MNLEDNIPYEILVKTPDEVKMIISKLILMGYIFSCERCKTLKEIREKWPNYKTFKYITVHTDTCCKMVLHASCCPSRRLDIKRITVEEFMNL